MHLNPVRVRSRGREGHKGLLRYLKSYAWSSLEGYLSYGKRKSWVVYDEVLSQVGGSRKKYAEFVEEGLKRGYSTPWKDLQGQVVLGQEGFWERVKERWRKRSGGVREQPSLRVLQEVGPEVIISRVVHYFRLKPEQLRKKRSGYRDQRGLVMEMMYRYGGLNQRKIGEYLGGMDYTAVSHERQRIRERMERDSKVKCWVRDLDSLLVS